MKTMLLALLACISLSACNKPAPEAATPAVADAPAPTTEPASGIAAAAPAPDAAPTAGKIALINATCPGDIVVHADEGGPVFINGREAKLGVSNENYYEATDAESAVTVSVSTDAGGMQTVSYTGKGGSNGICTVAP
jgi:hypothetical protein